MKGEKVKKTVKKSVLTSLAVLASICAFIPINAFAQINVTADGAYTQNDLMIHIYADLGVEMRSAGIKLTYNTAELENPRVEQNRKNWFLGPYDPAEEGPQGLPYPNGIDISTPGEIIIILGKLDTSEAGAHTAEGVSGTNILLGKVRFDRKDPKDMPYVPTGLDLSLGRAGKFANFVDINGNECDADPANSDDPGDCTTNPSFGAITVRERGNANASADDVINFQDMITVKQFTLNGGKDAPYLDCNDDLVINFQDMICIKQMTLQ